MTSLPQCPQLPRLDAEPDLAARRANITLDEQGGGRIEHQLALSDRWVDAIRMHAAEPPETPNGTENRLVAAHGPGPGSRCEPRPRRAEPLGTR